MNEALSKEFQELDTNTRNATNEAKLPESIQKYLEYQRHCLYEAYQNTEEVKPHPTTLKLPFMKRKLVVLDNEEWNDYYDFNVETLNTLIQAFKEISRLEDRIYELQPPKMDFDEFIKENTQQHDTEEFERILEHSNTLIDDILAEDYNI